MMTRRQRVLSLIVPLAIAGLAGCEKPPSTESMGEKVGQAATGAGKSIDQMAKDVERNVDKATAATAAAVDDAAITAKVKTAMLREPGLSAVEIGVATKGGVVSLSGTVGTERDRQRAEELAASIPSVKEVENRLVIKSAG
jgi:hyperosmotically inducible protein